MNQTITWIIYSLLIYFTVDSLSAQSFPVAKGGHCYNVEIPEYLTKTYQLNDVASLQYMNASKEAYVMVIDDSKDQLDEVGIKFVDSEDFLNSFIKDYQAESPNRTVSETRNFTANDNEHSQVEMSWDSGETKLYMLITSVETSEHFYKIMCWTLLEYKDDFKEDYLKISSSLVD